MSGYTLSQLELLYALSAPVNVSNITTQRCISASTSTVARCIIPSNYFTIPGKSLKFRAQGMIGSNPTTTFAFAVGLDGAAGTLGTAGGITVVQTASTTIGSGSYPFNIECDITAYTPGSASCLIACNGVVQVHTTQSAVFERANSAVGSSGAAWFSTQASINNETQLFLELFGAWQAAAANNSTTLQIFKVYGEN